jgi:hypothetical protein
VLPTLIEALKSMEIDTVKGAVHTLRLSTIEHTLARNWDYTDKYVLALIEAWSKFDRVLSPVSDTYLALGPKHLLECYHIFRKIQQSQTLELVYG